MQRVLKLNDFNGEPHYFVVDRVEDLYGMVTYSVSGDQCAIMLYTNGDHAILDAACAKDSEDRFMDYGPEDIDVTLVNDIPWEPKAYDA